MFLIKNGTYRTEKKAVPNPGIILSQEQKKYTVENYSLLEKIWANIEISMNIC